MDAKEKKIVQKITKELLKHLTIEGDFDFTEEDEVLSITLDTPDMGMVIGYHGEMLDALQLVLSLIISKKIGRFMRVSVEAGDYKKNRTEYLKTLAVRMKEKALYENQEVSLPSLKPWERRIVHLLLQDDKEVSSESMGEGRERTLVIKPR